MNVHSSKIRSTAVAGLFYPEDPGELGDSVETFLSDGCPGTCAPKALIVPHAGYIYSGPVAGIAFASLGARAARIRRVVLIGPSHRVGFKGVSVPSVEGFQTPLGIMPVALEAMDELRALPTVIVSDEPHALEHSLEVQLPFLQRVTPDAEIVPIVTGDASPA